MKYNLCAQNLLSLVSFNFFNNLLRVTKYTVSADFLPCILL